MKKASDEMPSVKEASTTNARVTRQLARKLQDTIARLENEALPAALDEVGKDAVADSVATKTYKDRTGNLRESHDYSVVSSGKSKDEMFYVKDGEEIVSFSSERNEISLFIFARRYYGFYVERVHGFDVLIQTFLKLRREFKTIFMNKLNARKLFR